MQSEATKTSASAEAGTPLFSASQLADALGVTDKAVRSRLKDAPAEKVPGARGQTANAWRWASIPDDWRAQIQATAARKGYRTPQDFFLSDDSTPWVPTVAFSAVPERFQAEARQWRDALLSVLRRQHDTPAGELLSLGLAECCRVFGREVSESTWRRHFDLAVQRDRGFEQWARLDIYLPEEAFTHAAGASEVQAAIEAADMDSLTDAFSQVANPSKLTPADKRHVWEAMFASAAPRDALLDYAFKALPGLARTRKALAKAFRRKAQALKAGNDDPAVLADKRAEKSGRPAAKLCPECERNVTGATVDLDGDLAQAWRRLHGGKILCRKCAGLWRFEPRINKSYVPVAVREQVMPKVLAALPWRHGPNRARLLAPYVLRRRDVGPGDVFEADDVTWNHVFYVWNTDENGRPYVGRGECLLFIDRGSWYPLGYRLIVGDVTPDGKQVAAHYTGEDVILGVLHVHDRVGLPHLGFQFENGIWRSRLVAGRQVRGWQFNQWREFEQGLNDPRILKDGLHFAGGADDGKVIRHALPGNPRTKIIERLIRAVQERMRHLPGFVGFNHRDYKPEVLNDFLRRVKDGNEDPANMFLGLAQFRDALDTELMAYAAEEQNGRWLPGVSPIEVWKNGIGQYPGVAARGLRKLPDSSRYLLSTHWRELPVTGQGIRFEVGGRPLVFWGDELKAFQYKRLPVRWNIEEPELLHCLPSGGAPFTLKLRELPSWNASRSELADTAAARQRWNRHGKAIFDNLPHPLISNIVNDNQHGAEVRAEGEAINSAVAEHRAQKDADTRETKRLAALAGTLGMETPKDGKLTERAVSAAQRRSARRASEQTETNV